MKAKDLAKLLLENPEHEVCVYNPNDSGYDVAFSVEKTTVVPTKEKKRWQGEYQHYSGPDNGSETIVLVIS